MGRLQAIGQAALPVCHCAAVGGCGLLIRPPWLLTTLLHRGRNAGRIILLLPLPTGLPRAVPRGQMTSPPVQEGCMDCGPCRETGRSHPRDWLQRCHCAGHAPALEEGQAHHPAPQSDQLLPCLLCAWMQQRQGRLLLRCCTRRPPAVPGPYSGGPWCHSRHLAHAAGSGASSNRTGRPTPACAARMLAARPGWLSGGVGLQGCCPSRVLHHGGPTGPHALLGPVQLWRWLGLQSCRPRCRRRLRALPQLPPALLPLQPPPPPPPPLPHTLGHRVAKQLLRPLSRRPPPARRCCQPNAPAGLPPHLRHLQPAIAASSLAAATPARL